MENGTNAKDIRSVAAASDSTAQFFLFIRMLVDLTDRWSRENAVRLVDDAGVREYQHPRRLINYHLIKSITVINWFCRLVL